MIDEKTRRQAKAYRARWKRITRFQIEQARHTTVEARWRELNAIFDFASEQGWLQPADIKEQASVGARWVRLKTNDL